MRKIVICGSRSWNTRESYEEISKVLKEFFGKLSGAHIVVATGGAKGADAQAVAYCYSNKIDHVTFHTNWKKWKKAAGPIRNKLMIEIFDPEYVIAFWDGESKGTANTIKLAKEAEKKVIVIEKKFKATLHKESGHGGH